MAGGPGGKTPRRVVCTGINCGGALAVVASVVMAVEFPGADIRCVTLNPPIISYGNVAFAWIYRCAPAFQDPLIDFTLAIMFRDSSGLQCTVEQNVR